MPRDRVHLCLWTHPTPLRVSGVPFLSFAHVRRRRRDHHATSTPCTAIPRHYTALETPAALAQPSRLPSPPLVRTHPAHTTADGGGHGHAHARRAPARRLGGGNLGLRHCRRSRGQSRCGPYVRGNSHSGVCLCACSCRRQSTPLARSVGEAQAGKKLPKPLKVLNLGPPKTQIPIQ